MALGPDRLSLPAYPSPKPSEVGLIMAKIARERIERAARIYASNRDAGMALGIAPGSFGRLCRHYGIPTPQDRRRRRFEDQRQNWHGREAAAA